MQSGMKTTQSSRFPQCLRVHVEVDVEAVPVTQRGGKRGQSSGGGGTGAKIIVEEIVQFLKGHRTIVLCFSHDTCYSACYTIYHIRLFYNYLLLPNKRLLILFLR
jgi:hypothetical protein